MQQVVVIHGGESFASYEEFWQNLVRKAFRFERLFLADWKQRLSVALGGGYQVLQPRMPNPQYARYREWSVWFEKLLPHLKDDVLLIGHSLGGSFVAKYLSEHEVGVRVRATFLVAAPFESDGGRRLVEFDIENDLALFARQGGAIFLYHSEDDPVVEFEEYRKFERLLPHARIRTFSDRQHFNGDSLPELVADIQSLA